MKKKLKRYIKSIFHLFGFDVVKYKRTNQSIPSFYNDLNIENFFDYRSEAYRAIKFVREKTMLPYQNLQILFEQVVYCEKYNIPGDYVECGVWKGGAMGLMALANLQFGNKRRHIHLFDIFDNICEPDPEVDGEIAIKEFQYYTGRKDEYSGRLKPVDGIYDKFGGPGTLKENKELLENIIKYPAKNISYHKGWFQETIPEKKKEIKEIAILRLDCDLYASMKICINELYDKVVQGGIIIIDDYHYPGAKKAIDEFIALKEIKTFLNYSNQTCRYIIKVK